MMNKEQVVLVQRESDLFEDQFIELDSVWDAMEYGLLAGGAYGPEYGIPTDMWATEVGKRTWIVFYVPSRDAYDAWQRCMHILAKK